MSGTKNSIIWFRKGLRLHDNPALLEAVKDAQHVFPIYILDPHFLSKGGYRVGVNRYNFLLESLRDLNRSFEARGSRLLVLRGTPEEVLPRIFKDWSIAKICFEVDTEPYALARDARVRELAAASRVEVFSPVSHTLYDTAKLVQRNGGKAPLTMGSFQKLVDGLGPPPPPAADPPHVLPPPAPGAKGADAPSTSVPTWQEMGFSPDEPPTAVFKGGESEALSRLAKCLEDEKWVAGFEKPATDPSAFVKPATTVLSPYLKFGCLSPRLFHAKLADVYKRHKDHSKPPVSLRGQLLWREFFYTVGAATPHFSRMAGNPVCRQIPWDHNDRFLEAWTAGRTGYPWIDAAMTQLRTWGWMHHLARHSVACFLTRGDLYVSWEAGQAVFEELLLDADHFINAGNWMWLSASAFFNQYYRVYSPITFGKKYDPDGKFIRHFLPVLKDLPSKYIYEPWTAPLDVQKRCGVVIGKDYPFPIVEHTAASKANMERMKAAYAANKGVAGDDEDDDGAAKPPPAKKSKAASSAAAAAAAGNASGSGASPAGKGGKQQTLHAFAKKA